jgi:hypothetical protein
LLVTAPLHRSADIDERVSLDAEGTLCIARILDRSSSEAAESAGEGLDVCAFGDVGSSRSAEGEGREEGGEDDASGLHFESRVGRRVKYINRLGKKLICIEEWMCERM